MLFLESRKGTRWFLNAIIAVVAISLGLLIAGGMLGTVVYEWI